MLNSLHVKNYALIKSLHFAPSRALNTITGETGAGKSIMLGALGLILGQRADTKALLDENEKCVVEGEFDIRAYTLQVLFEENDLDYADLCTIRREIAPNGKSRAFINDTPTTLEVLKELGEKLVDIHSQHDTLFLKKNDFQLDLIDAFSAAHTQRTEYQQAFFTYSKLKSELFDLQQNATQIRSEFDYNSFLLKELEDLNPISGEEVEIENELKLIDNAELIKTNLLLTHQLLDNPETGVSNFLYEATAALKQIHHLSPAYEKLFERLTTAQIEIHDLAKELESENESIEYDASRSNELKLRHDKLQRLFLKHHVDTADELIQLKDVLEEKVSKVNNLDAHIEALEKALDTAYKQAYQLAQQLSDKRKSCFDTLCQQIQQLVVELGMPEARLSIKHEETTLSKEGIDAISLLFSANKGIAPTALKQGASGGEMSRLVFAIKYILADKVALPTIVFDEIDTGISGQVALQMGKMMREMAKNHQVVAITHLPQIASKGVQHFYVYKDNSDAKTVSAMKELAPEERIHELAEMIGGKNPSDSAFASAKELLGL